MVETMNRSALLLMEKLWERGKLKNRILKMWFNTKMIRSNFDVENGGR